MGELVEEGCGGAFGLALGAAPAGLEAGEGALYLGDGGEEEGDGVDLGGAAPMLEGVEVAGPGAGARPLSTAGHGFSVRL